MDTLKKYFPLSFGAKDIANLVIRIVIYVVIGFVTGLAIGLLNNLHLPLLGVLTSIIGFVVELYTTGGIVLAILSYIKVIK